MVPEAVARPAADGEVREILQQASADRTSVTAAGGQTSTTGASITDRGMLLSMRAMDRVIDVDVASRRAVVEPGVLLGDLNRTLASHGLMFAPDPTSLDDVTVGGAIACNASGARSLLYGATRPHVQALTVALASGDVLEVRRSGLEKNTVGYAMAQEPVDWFVGSEGTLGVILRAELSLVPLPANVIGLAIPFASEDAALRCVVAIREGHFAPRCVEYFDSLAVAIAGQGDRPLLYVEAGHSVRSEGSMSGHPERSEGSMLGHPERSEGSALDSWLALLNEHGAIADDIQAFEGESALREARKFRHAVPATMNERGAARRAHGGRKVSTDWAVPYRRLGEAIAEARRLVDEAGLEQPVIYGHAGNGHPHQNFIASDAAELERIEGVVETTLKHVLSLGGTVSAEHGIGKIKRRWLPLQLSPLQLGVMRAVKRELDPHGILAPGNIL
jgi:glycolate oxidase